MAGRPSCVSREANKNTLPTPNGNVAEPSGPLVTLQRQATETTNPAVRAGPPPAAGWSVTVKKQMGQQVPKPSVALSRKALHSPAKGST